MKKPALGLLLGPKLGDDMDDMDDEDDEDMDDDGEAKSAAARAIMKAFRRRDVEALSEALTSFIELC